MAEMTAENGVPFARTFKGRLSAVILGVAAGIGIGSQLPSPTGQENNSGAVATGSATPTPTRSPERTLVITPRPTETATPTPEASKYVYWTKDQIEAAQKAAQGQGKTLLADTWSDKGASVQDAKTYNDHTILVIDGFKKDDLFEASFDGRVIVSVEVGRFKKYAVEIVTSQNQTITYYITYESDILVKNGQQITTGTPIAKLSDGLLPADLLFTKRGQVAIANETTFSTTTQNSLLKDDQGSIVRLNHN